MSEHATYNAPTSDTYFDNGDMDNITQEELERNLPQWAIDVNRSQEDLVIKSLMCVLQRSAKKDES